MNYLARARSAVAGFGSGFPDELDVASYEELPRALARRLRAERLPVRRVMWAGGIRGKRGWEREWLDCRFLVPSTAADLVVSLVLPEDAPSPGRALGFWFFAARAFHSLLKGGMSGAAPCRSVRFVAAWEGGRCRGRPVIPAAWSSFGAYQEIEVRAASDVLCLEAGGFAGAILAYFAARTPGIELSWGPAAGVARVRARGEGGAFLAAEVLLAAALWWRYSGIRGIFPVMSWLARALPAALWREVAGRLERSGLSWDLLASHALEASLAAVRGFAPALGNDSAAEEEAAGWCREIEVTVRLAEPGVKERPPAASARHKSLSWPKERGGFASKLDASRPYVTASGFAAKTAWTALPSWSRRTARRLLALADGERSLAEIALRLWTEFGFEWEAAVAAVSAAVRDGRLVPLRRSLIPRTLLYFAYGSCMSRTSFRETIPRFELIGEAALKGFRLAFTHRSAARAGGVADVVAEEGGEVRGILYRISRADLPDLDEREGVRLGRYRREWVTVEALGVCYPHVLTYSVVNKHPEDIPPSPEYAGLICEGARGLVDPGYVESVEALLARLGVEPELP